MKAPSNNAIITVHPAWIPLVLRRGQESGITTIQSNLTTYIPETDTSAIKHACKPDCNCASILCQAAFNVVLKTPVAKSQAGRC